MADLKSVPVRQSRHNVLSTVEHHLIVLVIGAALGSYFTVQVMSQQSAKTDSAVHAALKAVPVAQASKN
jgi:hypothetical protein